MCEEAVEGKAVPERRSYEKASKAEMKNKNKDLLRE